MKTRIKEMAMRKGVTQKVLAERMGVSLNAVKNYYIRTELSTTTLTKIANALECEVWQLIVSEYDVIKQGQGKVMTPDGKRYNLNDLQFCFDELAK